MKVSFANYLYFLLVNFDRRAYHWSMYTSYVVTIIYSRRPGFACQRRFALKFTLLVAGSRVAGPPHIGQPGQLTPDTPY